MVDSTKEYYTPTNLDRMLFVLDTPSLSTKNENNWELSLTFNNLIMVSNEP